jgi:hypothetical protein
MQITRFASFRSPIAIAIATTFSVPAYAFDLLPNVAPTLVATVADCSDDPGKTGTLRDLLAHAIEGEEIDVGCSSISLVTGATGGNDLTAFVANLSIVGIGDVPTSIDGQNKTRILRVGVANVDGMVTLKNMILRNGYTSQAVSSSSPYGGCIHAKGNLTLQSSLLTNCAAVATGKANAFGGAIEAYGLFICTVPKFLTALPLLKTAKPKVAQSILPVSSSIRL